MAEPPVQPPQLPQAEGGAPGREAALSQHAKRIGIQDGTSRSALREWLEEVTSAKINSDADWRDIRPRVPRRQRARVFAQPVPADVRPSTVTSPLIRNHPAPAVHFTPAVDAKPSTSNAPDLPQPVSHRYFLRKRNQDPSDPPDTLTARKRQRCAALQLTSFSSSSLQVTRRY